jgi:hypothetical protein
MWQRQITDVATRQFPRRKPVKAANNTHQVQMQVFLKIDESAT